MGILRKCRQHQPPRTHIGKFPHDCDYYKSTLYVWHHEPQNEYESRHISISDAGRVVEDDNSVVMEQDWYEPSRYKHIGHGHAGLITVITEGNHIVTAWHSSKEEVKAWLQKN